MSLPLSRLCRPVKLVTRRARSLSPRPPLSPPGFTLVELLVSLAVLAVLLVVIAQVLGQVQRVWSSANSKVAQFREARRAMDRIQNNLSQATMNTYLQYFYTAASPFVPPSATQMTAPTGYVRFSELQFLTGSATNLVAGGGESTNPGHAVFFQAPLGGAIDNAGAYVNLPTALTACGYFIEFGADNDFRPPFLNQIGHPERRRYRLFEYRTSIINNAIYKDIAAVDNNPGVPNDQWYRNPSPETRRPVAENIIYMVISPKRAAVGPQGGDPRDIASQYAYDSSANGVNLNQTPQDFQLPPLIEVTLIALDEESARRLVQDSGGTPNLPGGLFTNASEANFRSDLERLENMLNERKLNYRVFNTTVPIRNSKWGL